jgi:hypothetical protein
MSVELIVLCIIAIAALGGIVLTGIRLGGKPRPPTWMAIGHGIVATTGVGLLGYLALLNKLPLLSQIALGVFVLAAMGGTVLFAGFHLRERPLPIPLVIGHGLIALIGVAMLFLSTYRIVEL